MTSRLLEAYYQRESERGREGRGGREEEGRDPKRGREGGEGSAAIGRAPRAARKWGLIGGS